MRARPIISTLAAVVVAGAVSAAGLGVETAAAAAPYRSAAGLYEFHLYLPGEPVESALMLLKPDHTAEVEGASSGTWSQPGLNGTIVVNFVADGDSFSFTGLKMSNGIGSWANPGILAEDGSPVAYFWADAEAS